MLYLLKRLKSQMQGGTREITKVAQTFSEIGNAHLYMMPADIVHIHLFSTLNTHRPVDARERFEWSPGSSRSCVCHSCHMFTA